MTNTVRIDARRALEVIDKAVEERGEDWVYPDTSRCRYFYDPEDYQFMEDEDDDDPGLEDARAMVAFFGDEVKPACLVGCAVHLIDENLDTLLIHSNASAVDSVLNVDDSDTFTTVIGDTEYVFEAGAVTVLMAGQSAQDCGMTWGESRMRAYAAAERLGIH